SRLFGDWVCRRIAGHALSRLARQPRSARRCFKRNMSWIALSSKEWQRRPLRTTLTALGVAIAVAALFSLLSFQRGYQAGVHQELDRLGAHILVVPKGCPYDAASIALHGASWPCYLKGRYLEEIRATPGVATAAPALMAAFYDETSRQNVYVGIDRS